MAVSAPTPSRPRSPNSWRQSFRLIIELTRFELILNTSRSKLGWAWWFIDPLFMIGVLGIFKDIVIGDDRYRPYFVFVGCALLSWKFFSTALARSTSLLRAREAMIKSFPFPTWVLPCALVLEQLIFFVAGILMLTTAAILLGQPIGVGLIQAFPLTALVTVLALGSVLLCSTLGVFYTALNQYINHFIRIVWLLSPGMYGTDLVVERFGEGSLGHRLFLLNPIALIFEGFRSILFEPQWISWSEWLTLTVICSLVLTLGVLVFRHYNRRLIKHF